MSNRIKAELLVLIVGYIVIFLLGSFISMSFNPVQWHIATRIITGTLCLIFTLRVITT